jgi:hypothetical protein
MLTRRRVLRYSALAPAILAQRGLLPSAEAQTPTPLRLAVIGNTYRYGSDLQIIADRFLVGYQHDADWHIPHVKVVSLYLEPKPGTVPSGRGGSGRRPGQEASQRMPVAPVQEHDSGAQADLSAGRAKEFGFRLCRNIPEALRVGGTELAVDAVLSVVDRGEYPRNHKGQILYPRYDFFQQCVQVFEEEGRALPYFNHDSLSFSFHQAESMVATAERLKFPLMSGSSLPVTWRLPDIDIPFGAQIQDAVMVCPYQGMEFDALEAMQCMLERRKGGETGVKAVQLLEGDDVWAAGESGRWSKEVLSSALSRSDAPLGLTLMDGRQQDMANSGALPQVVKDPAAFCIEYNDGTHATLLVLDGADRDFTFSARVAGHGFIATQFFRSPVPNVAYSASLTAKIEQMFVSGTAPHPVRRTLLTSGILEAAMTSKYRLNQRLETPQLAAVKYQPPSESQYVRT